MNCKRSKDYKKAFSPSIVMEQADMIRKNAVMKNYGDITLPKLSIYYHMLQDTCITLSLYSPIMQMFINHQEKQDLLQLVCRLFWRPRTSDQDHLIEDAGSLELYYGRNFRSIFSGF